MAKSICPFDTICDTSADVLPVCRANRDNTGTPAIVSCNMSSPCNLPRAITDVKIAPVS
ncbi:hypothetical protein [Cutibacterium phage FD3]|nr:hypothetical protein [Cutibacterium phage FD3]